ncbi:glycosyltransferase family 2 protein [Roseivivax isoporae]|uniref:Glycosyl transferase n=1 Tax=Roseivivax isoporae LMG 25204 TaxID=1449351 RepID=X7F8W7_9RHOB|nr:glycosyltransferase [Roseivivax isoporae]ETX28511.1 glycosyl transferase [Roseivivax isoporae LMG 25204]
MEPPSVSVIVVSRGRPALLSRCITGLSQLDWPRLELVVVACPDGCAVVSARPDAAAIKLVPFDVPNISAARNHGIAAAAGEIVAFIDDDSVPEPSWLRHLLAVFADPEVAAAGGHVIGRNGITLQWGSRAVDSGGVATPLAIHADKPTVLTGRPGRAIKTEGTNMALRREALAAAGGFDPAFRFYLDETDLDMRLAAEGAAVAIVPRAQVHHGYAESARRAGNRTPRDLFEIGASTMVFLRKHCPPELHARHLERLRADQRARLLRALRDGPLDPLDVRRILHGLERGIADGAARPTGETTPLPRAAEGFRAFAARPGATHHVFTGPWRRRAALRRAAQDAVAAGDLATVLLLSPTALYHRMRFRPEGFWEQAGGIFGRSDRGDPLFTLHTRRSRAHAEVARLATVRPLSEDGRTGGKTPDPIRMIR